MLPGHVSFRQREDSVGRLTLVSNRWRRRDGSAVGRGGPTGAGLWSRGTGCCSASAFCLGSGGRPGALPACGRPLCRKECSAVRLGCGDKVLPRRRAGNRVAAHRPCPRSFQPAAEFARQPFLYSALRGSMAPQSSINPAPEAHRRHGGSFANHLNLR